MFIIFLLLFVIVILCIGLYYISPKLGVMASASTQTTYDMPICKHHMQSIESTLALVKLQTFIFVSTAFLAGLLFGLILG